MLHFNDNTLHQQTSWAEKTWTLAELFETPDPLHEEPMAERIAALQKAAGLAVQNTEVFSPTAQLYVNFWINFQPQRLAWHSAIYKSRVDDQFDWEIKISESGIFFKDVSGQYDTYNEGVSAQLFSDFWFFGPRRPIPDRALREKMVETMKKGFSDPDCPAAKAHFELFDYPTAPPANLHWEEGNHVRTDYLTVRPFGVEMSHITFRDGPSGTGFLSFERLLNMPLVQLGYISPAIREKIEKYIGKTSIHSLPRPLDAGPKALTPLEKMDLIDKLLKDPDSVEGVEVLISLLELEDDPDYWHSYVFNRCYKLRTNRRVQTFVADCLQGNQEVWFKKACEVLTYWGLFLGEKPLADKTLLNALNWEDATANDPDFRAALDKTLKIIHSKP